MSLTEVAARVQQRAATVRPGRHLLGLLLLLPIAVGWLAGAVVRVTAFVWAYTWAAVQEGYEMGRGRDGR